jgi:beta-glucosidase
MGWEVYPEGLRVLLDRVHRDYTFPAYYITENGVAFADVVETDGAVHDERRSALLQGHFRAAAQAIRDGVPMRGYFVWSLLDNFEWGHGYSQRFGIVYVDYATQQRIVKDSGRWYQQFLAARSTTAAP